MASKLPRLFTLVIKPIKKKKEIKNVNAITKIGKLVIADVIEIDGVYKAKVVNNTDAVNSEFVVLDFTDRSFDCVNRECVFSRKKDKLGHYVRIIEPSSFSYPREHYIPFVPTWMVNGYLCKADGKLMFDFNKLERHVLTVLS